jgi:hypothetical protein
MLAVASARLTSAGGSGTLGLWSCHRPFMPLSVVEGHKEGAIGDFVWLETPQEEQQTRSQASTNDAPESNGKSRMRRQASLIGNSNDETVVIRGSARGEAESILFDNKDNERDDKKRASPRIWQHALSVGRDGRCLLQAFTKGELIISFRVRFQEISHCFLIVNCFNRRRSADFENSSFLLCNGGLVPLSKRLRFTTDF